MRHRDFLALGTAALAWPRLASAQRAARVGLFFSGYVARENGAFLDAMRRLRYVEGQSVAYLQRTSTASSAAQAAAKLVAGKPDVIVTSAPLNIRALKEAIATIPIVIAVTGDAVENGLVASLARPQGNVTALSFQSRDLMLKRLQLLHETFPDRRRIAVFDDPTNPAGTAEAVRQIGADLGLDVQVLEVADAAAFDGAFAAAAAADAQAIAVVSGRVITPNADQFLALATRYRLPVACHQGTLSRAGCLLSYGPSFPEMFRRAAVYVDRILKGAKPSELPVEQPTKFELVINLKTAKALGLSVPQALLARADEVIE